MNHVIINGSVHNIKNFEYQNGSGAKFGLAYRRAKDDYIFFNCTMFNKTADLFFKYVSEKDKITVSGKLDVNTWQDRDGNTRTTYNIIVNEFTFPSTSKKQEKTNTYTPNHQPAKNEEPKEHLPEDADFPF